MDGTGGDMTGKRTACRALVGKLESGNLGVGVIIILKYVLKK
jgi:hypothetical protein